MNRLAFRLALASAVGLPALGTGCIVVDSDDPPPLFVYDPCARTSDCEALADRCFEVTVDYGSYIVTDGMCSLYCIDDFDCPDRGACLSIDGQEPICYERCVDDFDCPRGFACLDAVGRRSVTPICLPE